MLFQRMEAYLIPLTPMFTVISYTGDSQTPLRAGKFILETSASPQIDRPLLFIAGLGGSVKMALNVLNHLLGTYHPIYGIDLRGFGLNEDITGLTTIKQVLSDIDHFINTVIFPQHGNAPLTLAGISLGAALATHLAVTQPSLFNALMLLAPAYAPHPKVFSVGYKAHMFAAALRQASMHTPIQLPYGISALTRNPAVLKDPQYKDAEPLKVPLSYLLDVEILCNQASHQARDIPQPTLVIIPGKDQVCCPVAMRSAYWRIRHPQKQCVVFPELFHDMLIEPEWQQVAETLKTWSRLIQIG